MGPAPDGYNAEMAWVAPLIGAKLLGYSVTKIQPDSRAFPRHNHQVNEELFFILEGEGEVRIGDQIYPIKKGDFIACPPGGKETAHQIKNTGSNEMLVLGVSTKMAPEIAEYPDSGKFGVMAAPQTGPDGQPRQFRFLGREGESLSYWEGEK